jgi:hypothetical protein
MERIPVPKMWGFFLAMYRFVIMKQMKTQAVKNQ